MSPAGWFFAVLATIIMFYVVRIIYGMLKAILRALILTGDWNEIHDSVARVFDNRLDVTRVTRVRHLNKRDKDRIFKKNMVKSPKYGGTDRLVRARMANYSREYKRRYKVYYDWPIFCSIELGASLDRMRFDDYDADMMLNHPSCKIAAEKTRVNLVRVKPEQFGLKGGGYVDREAMLKRAIEYGLDLCAIEVGPQFIQQIGHSLEDGDWYFIGSEPIVGPDGRPRWFVAGCSFYGGTISIASSESFNCHRVLGPSAKDLYGSDERSGWYEGAYSQSTFYWLFVKPDKKTKTEGR